MHDCACTDTGTNGDGSARYRDAHHGAASGAVSSFDGSSHSIHHNNNNHNRNLLRTENLLRLALKKPPAWQWELTTSSSSPNISFPKIQLFDSTSGELMVEVNQPDCLIRSAATVATTGDGEQSEPSGTPSPPAGRALRRSLTWIAKERVPTSGDSLTDIFRQLHSKGLGHKLATSGSQYKLSEIAGALEPEMKPATPPDAQPSKPRRRSRRSLASRSNSMLGRISERYSGRKSTDEDDEDVELRAASTAGVTIEEVVDDTPPPPTPPPPRPKIYKLVRSNAGTLMVREESFHTQRSLRRRQPAIHPATIAELASEPSHGQPDVDRIGELLSRVMLSHELRTTEETPAAAVGGCPPASPARVCRRDTSSHSGHSTSRRRRQTWRSVSAGGSFNTRSPTSSRRGPIANGQMHPQDDPATSPITGDRLVGRSSSSSPTPTATSRSRRSGSAENPRSRARHRASQQVNGGGRSSKNGEQAISNPAVLSAVVRGAGISVVDLLSGNRQDEEEPSQEPLRHHQSLRQGTGALRSAATTTNAASGSSLLVAGLRRRVSDNAIILRKLVRPNHLYAWLRRTPVSPAISNPVAPEVKSLAERRTALANGSGSSSISSSSSSNSSMGTKMSSCCRLKTPGLTADRRTKSTGNLNQDTAQYFYQYQQHHNNNNPVDVLLLRASLQVSNGSGRSSEKESLGVRSPKQPPPRPLPPPQPDLASCATLPVGADSPADSAATVICGSLPTYLEYDRPGSPPYGEVQSGEQEAIVQLQNKELLYGAADRKHPIVVDHQLRRVLYCSPHITDTLGCDQGYGSERSPEDEPPPSPTTASVPQRLQRPQPPELMAGMLTQPPEPSLEPDDSLGNPLFDPFTLAYPFITDDSIFCVQIAKSANEVGLSFSGGKDSTAPYPGLIRIKRLFPHMPAWNTGALQPGDIVLAVNDTPLTGLTNYQALKVLRKADRIITLIVCRPPDDEYRKLSPPIEQPRPPLRAGLGYPSPLITINDRSEQQQQQQEKQEHSLQEKPAYCGFGSGCTATLYHPGMLQPLPDPVQTSCSGEFEIVLTKQQGSLGFTMHKEDDSVLGHCVRALVREPALSDGRIRPGDKIVAVNGVLLAGMTHEEAVLFTRQTGDTVRLRLYRDQSPSPTASPTSESTLLLLGGRGAKTAGLGRVVPAGQRLRPEALNLLANLAAYRKQQRQHDGTVGGGETSLDRRLIRKAYVHCPSGQCRHSCVPATLQQHHSSDVTRSPVSGLDGTVSCGAAAGGEGGDGDGGGADLDHTFYADEELEAVLRADDCGLRLQLADDGSSSSSLGRQAWPVPGAPAADTPAPGTDSPVSLPCETFLVACTTDQDLRQAEDCDGRQTREAIYVQHFAHKALYASVTVPTRAGAAEMVEAVERGGRKGLMKWKGATLLPDEKTEKPAEPSTGNSRGGPADAGNSDNGNHSPVGDATQSPTPEAAATATRTTGYDETSDFQARGVTDDGPDGCEVITVELNRGWNSRLGFSLSQDSHRPAHQATGARTVISAIHPDSVAARDGRLRVGDVLLKVNGESVEWMPTASVIELIRIVRGAIFIKLLRPTGSDTMQATPAPSDTVQDADGDGHGETGYTIVPTPPDGTLVDQLQH